MPTRQLTREDFSALAMLAKARRDLARHSVDLARQTVATGTKIAGLFADMGTATTMAIGAANALAGLGLKLFALGLDIKDLRAGNKRLATPATLDLTVFADIGLPGWMDRVETMKSKQMEPLLKIASKAIDASPLQLEGLATDKGTHQKKGFFAGIKAKVTKRILG